MKTMAQRSVTSTAVLVVALVVGFVFSAVARAAPGDLDPTFSGDGRQTTNFASGGGANGVALQGGRIVAVGSGLGTDLSSDLVVARYLGSP